jgi:large subunit ribosomal protein L17
VAEIRKLGRKTDHRLAMLKNLTTSVIWHGQIETTEAKAKEVKSIVDSLISLAIKEKDNYEMVEETVSLAKIDEKTGNKVTETVTSKNGKSYTRVVRENVTRTVKKDNPSRLAARKKIIANINKVKDAEGNNVDLPGKMFGEIAEKYADRKGGYTRIIKLGQRRGDAAEAVILQLV